MKTLIALLVSWILAIAVWVGFVEVTSGGTWGGPGDFVTPAVFLGAPLIILVPLAHLPLLKWLSRCAADGLAQHMLSAVTSGLLAVPAALWPVLTFGGSPRDLTSFDGRHYAVLYVAFGVAFGAWYSISLSRSR